jgi:hypothetical protein
MSGDLVPVRPSSPAVRRRAVTAPALRSPAGVARLPVAFPVANPWPPASDRLRLMRQRTLRICLTAAAGAGLTALGLAVARQPGSVVGWAIVVCELAIGGALMMAADLARAASAGRQPAPPPADPLSLTRSTWALEPARQAAALDRAGAGRTWRAAQQAPGQDASIALRRPRPGRRVPPS